jgi:hypothetical protein
VCHDTGLKPGVNERNFNGAPAGASEFWRLHYFINAKFEAKLRSYGNGAASPFRL